MGQAPAQGRVLLQAQGRIVAEHPDECFPFGVAPGDERDPLIVSLRGVAAVGREDEAGIPHPLRRAAGKEILQQWPGHQVGAGLDVRHLDVLSPAREPPVMESGHHREGGVEADDRIP